MKNYKMEKVANCLNTKFESLELKFRKTNQILIIKPISRYKDDISFFNCTVKEEGKADFNHTLSYIKRGYELSYMVEHGELDVKTLDEIHVLCDLEEHIRRASGILYCMGYKKLSDNIDCLKVLFIVRRLKKLFKIKKEVV